MTRLVQIACVLLLALSAMRVDANSFYWDPAFNGEGWSIDRQNDVVFLAWYTYEANNQPTFFTAAGVPSYSVIRGPDASEDIYVAQFTATLARSVRGQPAQSAGALTFRHEQGDGIDRILVNAAGQQRTLVPFMYAYPQRGDALQGLWAFSFIDANLDVIGALGLFEEEAIPLGDGGLVFGVEPASGREIVAVYVVAEPVIVLVMETNQPNIDLVAAVFHGVKDSRPMRGIWVLVDSITDEEVTDLLPFTGTKYRSLGELDAVGVYAPKSNAGQPSAFRQRVMARLEKDGIDAFHSHLRRR
ncbi:MAG TPA: hypothetical protein PKZ76_12655 [Xanthomonadaceae bacterium]|nr:hypothetical protein [Xanthomonadaceae bacterium]